MKAIIELRNIEIYAYHGCFHEEQVVGNRFIVDADLEVDAQRPCETDNVKDALNYADVCRTIREVMACKQHLLECVTANIVKALHARFDSSGLEGGWVRVRKMVPPIGMQIESVGVKMRL